MELVPVLLGFVIGLGAARFGRLNCRAAAALAAPIGASVTVASGEIGEGFPLVLAFLVFDALIAVGAAVISFALASRLGWSREQL